MRVPHLNFKGGLGFQAPEVPVPGVLVSFLHYVVFFSSSNTIKIRVNENSSSMLITHVDDFGKHFPDVGLSPPSRRS